MTAFLIMPTGGALFADLQSPIVRSSDTSSPNLVDPGAEALATVADILGVPKPFSVVPEDGEPETPAGEL